MTDSDQQLTAALGSLGNEFKPNELAYLATTMKIEGPIRDRLAFRLHQELSREDHIVSREWRRIDLAVLDTKCEPRCLVELKAMYTFDAFKNLRKFVTATSEDERKARKLAKGAAVYSLLLATHLGDSIPPHLCGPDLRGPVKYWHHQNAAINFHGDAARLLSQATARVDENLKEARRSVVSANSVDGGEAFGLKVAVHYWLVRNVPPLNPG